MKRCLLALCGISVAALLSCPAAFADTFNFSFSGSGFMGSGTFTATETSPTSGQYLITNVTGTTNGVTISGLLAPGVYPGPTSGDPANDNLLFVPLVNGGALDINGFSWATADGTDWNLYYYDPGYGLVTDANFDSYDYLSLTVTDTTTGVTLVGAPTAVAPTPEPGSLVMLGTAVLGMAAMVRRRFVI